MHCKPSIRTMQVSSKSFTHMGQSLHECHVRMQRLNAKQDALETAIGALTDAQARLNEAMLSQEREGELRKARLDVLSKSSLKR